jgi:hypothetical protein
MRRVTADATSPTGFSYPDGITDGTVRTDAEAALGSPVYRHQVVNVRRFMRSVFTSGEATTGDIKRIRNFFFGPIVGELPEGLTNDFH